MAAVVEPRAPASSIERASAALAGESTSLAFGEAVQRSARRSSPNAVWAAPMSCGVSEPSVTLCTLPTSVAPPPGAADLWVELAQEVNANPAQASAPAARIQRG